jgi:predicted enzyme related to lactoylglutathione lyase
MRIGGANGLRPPRTQRIEIIRENTPRLLDSGVVMNPDFKLSDIRQIAITVSDASQALKFYRDVLGLSFLFSPSPNLAFLSAGSVRLMLTTPQGAGTVGKNSILYFKVTDIAAAHATIVSRGAREERGPQLAARMPDHELWIAFVRDPDGNLVGLMEEKR